MERKLKSLLGFDIDTFGFDEAVSFALNLINEKKGGQVVTINPEMIENALEDRDFASILKSADLVIPDGIGVKIALKIKGVNVQRIAGIEFSHKLIEECSKLGFSVAFIGAKPNIIKKAAENLKNDFSDLNISYLQDGYFQDQKTVFNEILQASPRLVLVALGSPKQEFFIQKCREFLPEALMIGVGGSFDVWSGEVQRAPEIYQKLGLEWLYRTIKQPERFKRIFPTLPRFLFRVLFS